MAKSILTQNPLFMQTEYDRFGVKMNYRYKITSTGHSSKKYGSCEVCGKYASEVFYQVEERQYQRSPEAREWLRFIGNPGDEFGWTRLGCQSYYGHKSCLEGTRREVAR